MVRTKEDATLVSRAARNNAELCDAVCRSHGAAGELAAEAWTSRRRTPDLYPDAVTLDASAAADDVLARIDAGAGASVKDSFASLDLARHGFRILFSAEWIWRPGPGPSVDVAGSGLRWSPVVDPAGLADWEAAWSDDGIARDRFRAELLAASGVEVLLGTAGDSIAGGMMLNRSADVVGVSNLFSMTGDLGLVWSTGSAAVSARVPDLAIVGYESGAMLDAARAAGFTSIGTLRVWIND